MEVDAGEPLFPDDCLGTIFSYLTFKDLLKPRKVCWQWHEVADEEHIWRGLVIQRWVFASNKPPDSTWRGYFVLIHTRRERWQRGAPRDFKMFPMRGHADYIVCSQLAAPLAFSGSADRTARVWRQQEDRSFIEAATLPHTGQVNALSVYDKTKLFTGDASGMVRLWDLDRLATPVAQQQHSAAPVTHLAADEDNEILVTASGDGVVKVWDERIGAAQHTLPHGAGSVLYVGCAWDKKQQVVSATDSEVRVWDTRAANKVLHTHSPGARTIAAADWNPRSDDVAIGLAGSQIQVFNTKRGTVDLTTPSYSPVTCIRRSNNRVVAGTERGEVMLVTHASGNATPQTVRRLTGHTARINDVRFDDNRVVSAAADGCLLLHDTQNGEKLFALLGGSLAARATNPPHPAKPWFSAVHFDDAQILAVWNSMMRTYHFDM